ncbi:UNVERIFIED_CONTAM: putative pentatricopeptide repeat-containing protein, mitochondrial [Sesamum radiatum]|uniref:Pentatricopeptide repeat-containing protein, mitochondrial n=1 Tax=Sesamum radiatum TaxID=300843 RepID=A0AAW2S318_SESRA
MFDEIPVKNTVCANALMSGYAEAKMWDQGIQLVRRMPILGLAVDNFTMSAALRACSGLCALEFGKQVHANIIRCIIDVGADVFLQRVYGRNGNYIEVIRLFKSMLMEGIRPDGVAFLTVISACGHTGQVDLGMEYFESMTRDYGLVASQEHYSCLVDLLCRAGELERACKLVSEMPFTGTRAALYPCGEHC